MTEDIKELLNEIFLDDIIEESLQSQMGASIMKSYILIPNSELDRVNKANRLGIKYEFNSLKSTKHLGTGVYTYLDLKHHTEYLTKKAIKEGKSILELEIDTTKVINTLTDLGQRRLKEIAEYSGANTEEELLKYISNKAVGLIGIQIEGKATYNKSILTKEFIGLQLCIYDEAIIKSYKVIKKD